MSPDGLQAGSVITYPYLWDRQASQGETEGRKDRPVVVVLRLTEGGTDRVILLPVTSKRPGKDRLAVELPEMEKRRAGLHADLPLWLILDECNQDNVRGSYYLRPQTPSGVLSRAFLLPVLRRLAASWRNVRVVSRQ